MNTTEGRILPVLANAIAAFRHAPEWGGVLAFNEFGFGTVALKPAPWGIVPKGEWTDHEDRLAAEWLQKQGILVSVEVAGQAVQTAARDHPFHPVKSYLQGLDWDGVERVDTLALHLPRCRGHGILACGRIALARSPPSRGSSDPGRRPIAA